MEPDAVVLRINSERKYFNPRAPCGARLFGINGISELFPFQSTGSVWSPTLEDDSVLTKREYFNPRAPCGARPHAPKRSAMLQTFQSTGSVWSPTCCFVVICLIYFISIHGLRVEPDYINVMMSMFIHISIHGLRVEPDR